MDITIGIAQVYCCKDTYYTISHMIATEEMIQELNKFCEEEYDLESDSDKLSFYMDLMNRGVECDEETYRTSTYKLQFTSC